MRKIELGQAIGILANLGVIAGIAFLAVELRQNNALMAADARLNRLQMATGSHTFIAGHPEFAALLAKSDRSIEGLTAGEREQLLSFGSRVLLNQEWTFNELPREDLPIENWRRTSSRGYWQMAWMERGQEVGQDFVMWMEENVLAGGSRQ